MPPAGYRVLPPAGYNGGNPAAAGGAARAAAAETDNMKPPTVFETCRPRGDILEGSVSEADFAADLAQAAKGGGSGAYLDPAEFFANTYPTRGLKDLLANVCRRLSGAGGEAAAIFRLDTSYGGGKTHGLIALVHAARGARGAANIAEFVDPALLPPQGTVRTAVFDGENADPANGRDMGGGVRACTPWGEIAHALAGEEGWKSVRKSDESRVAPGAETLRGLFGGEPTLILLDELSIYLRKTQRFADARGQLTAFLTTLFKAVESAPNAALVFTLAIGKDGRAADAYSEENRFLADAMAELESVSARKATLLNPTEDDETAQVLRRRLFASIDEKQAERAAAAYAELWTAHQDALSAEAARAETAEAFRAGYPLHPEVLETLTGKTATLANFQRVRGMLRLLARAVGKLWRERPADATAIHLHHIDLGCEPIRQEVLTRLDQRAYAPAIENDVAAAAGKGAQVRKKALSQEIDAEHHGGLPPYAAYAARVIFLHTLAFNEQLRGLSAEQLRYSLLCPALDLSFIEEARRRFVADSAYLDDRPGAPMRFLAEANLLQIVRREERRVDAGEARAELNDRIREIFGGKTFDAAYFPGGPFDAPDEVGGGLPKLAVMAYDGVSMGSVVERVPELIARIYKLKGSEGSAYRALRNNLVFVAADEARKEEMQGKTYSRLALRELKKPERLSDLAEHQQAKVLEMEARSEQELAIAVQQCYRHVFYPSRNKVEAEGVDLAHSAIEIHAAADRPGAGQQQIERALRDLQKLKMPEDEPDSPAYVRDRTPLRKGHISVRTLRDEFRRDPALPMLIGDDVFIRGLRMGIEQGEYVYRRGELLLGPGDPPAELVIDEQAVILTMAYAKNTGVWPRPKPQPQPQPPVSPPAQPPKPAGGGSAPAPQPPKPPAPPVEAGDRTVEAEGVLKEALTSLWEKARAKKIAALGSLTITMFEPEDAFRLLGAVGAAQGAEKTVAVTGGYETGGGGSLQIEFRGPARDAQPLKEFLEPQMRGAASVNIHAAFELTFPDGLDTGAAAEKLAERLARFAVGTAHVTAREKAEK